MVGLLAMVMVISKKIRISNVLDEYDVGKYEKKNMYYKKIIYKKITVN